MPLAAIRQEQPEPPPAQPTTAEQDIVDRVLLEYPEFQRHQLLSVLHSVRAEIGWFSPELTRYLGERLGIPFADLYGVITFYALFKTTPTGQTVVRVCKGLPCYLHGAYTLGLAIQDILGVEPGVPTPDGQFSWEWFACLGQCDHAPAILMGDEAVGPITSATLDKLLTRRANDNGQE